MTSSTGLVERNSCKVNLVSTFNTSVIYINRDLGFPCLFHVRSVPGRNWSPFSIVLPPSISHWRNPSRLESAARLLGGGPREHKGLIFFKLCSPFKIPGPEPQGARPRPHPSYQPASVRGAQTSSANMRSTRRRKSPLSRDCA